MEERIRRGSPEDVAYIKSLIDEGTFNVKKHPLYREQTYLQMAATSGSCEMVKLIAEESRRIAMDINAVDWYGEPVLFYASSENNYEMFELLLEYGANPNFISLEGESALFCTTNVKIMEVLLNKGVDINKNNGEEESPLSILVTDFDPERSDEYYMAIKFLIEHGADTSITVRHIRRYVTLREYINIEYPDGCAIAELFE